MDTADITNTDSQTSAETQRDVAEAPKTQATETTDKAASGETQEQRDARIKELEAQLTSTAEALKNANQEAADRRHKLKPWEELGVDPDTVKSWAEERAEADRKLAEERGQYQELMQGLEGKISEAQEAAQAQVTALEDQIQSLLVDSKISEAIAAENGVPRLLQGPAKDAVKLIKDEDGTYTSTVVDSSGNPRFKEDGSPMEVVDLIREFREDPDLKFGFRATATGGTRTDTGSTDAPAAGKQRGPKKSRSKMSTKEKGDYVAKYGFEEFSKLPA